MKKFKHLKANDVFLYDFGLPGDDAPDSYIAQVIEVLKNKIVIKDLWSEDGLGMDQKMYVDFNDGDFILKQYFFNYDALDKNILKRLSQIIPEKFI